MVIQRAVLAHPELVGSHSPVVAWHAAGRTLV